MTWNQSACSDCWAGTNPEREPVRSVDRRTERCSYCGIHHRSGIYVRADPTSVPFPRGVEA